MAEKGWRSPGEVWRAYEAKMPFAQGVRRELLIDAGGCGAVLGFLGEDEILCAVQRPCPQHGGPGGTDLV